MIHKMYSLCEHVPKKTLDLYDNEYGLQIGPLGERKVIVLQFILEESSFELIGSEMQDYDMEKNLTDYFFRSAKGRAHSPFLSLYISADGMKNEDSKEYDKDSKDYRKILTILRRNADTNEELTELLVFFEQNFDLIIEELNQYLEDNSDYYILTLSIDGDLIGKSKYFEKVRLQAAKDVNSVFYTLGSREIIGRNLHCSMCREMKEEIWGFFSIYNFYTAKTEHAPIAGGLKREKAYKNYPVCPDCGIKLKRLKPIVDKYFRFKFCGFDYMIIPEVLDVGKGDEAIELIIDIMVAQYNADPGSSLGSDGRLGELSLGKRKKIVDSYSKEVFDCLSQTDVSSSYTMLFFAEKQNEFKLLLSIEDLFPSQFEEIFKAKELAENHYIFQNLPTGKKNETYDLEFRFDILKEFLPINSKKEGDFSKAFLEATRSIFMQKPISQSFLMQRIISIVRNRFVNDENYELAARKAFLLIKFLHYLNQLSNAKEIIKKESVMTGKLSDFFAEHDEFFDSSAKQYVFMVGVLTEYLLNIQYSDRNASPFRNRLNGMKLDGKIVHRIYTEAIEKLNQYDKNYYKALEAEIAALIVKGGIDRLANDEISFVFTLGMTLAKDFKTTKENTEIQE